MGCTLSTEVLKLHADIFSSPSYVVFRIYAFWNPGNNGDEENNQQAEALDARPASDQARFARFLFSVRDGSAWPVCSYAEAVVAVHLVPDDALNDHPLSVDQAAFC